MRLVVWLVLVGCRGGVASQALDDVGQGACGELVFAEARVPCQSELAVNAARDGQPAVARGACDAVDLPLWRDACHLRAGEALALGGDLAAAAGSCTRAGRYVRVCMERVAWWAQPFPIELGPQEPGAGDAVEARLRTLEALSAELDPSELSMLRASVWFDLYLGSGSADPGPARSSDAPEGRTAWAHEAVRLSPGGAAADLLAAWAGRAPAPEGGRLAPRCWQGQVEDPVAVPELVGLPRTALVRGGQRLVGQGVEEDLAIAIMEARAFHGVTDPAELRGALEDPRLRVRISAARLLARSAGPAAPEVVALLHGPDATLRAAAEAGLRSHVIEWHASTDCP